MPRGGELPLLRHPARRGACCGGAIKSYFSELAGAEVIDRYTFRVRWKRSVAHSFVFTVGMYPMPRWLYSRDEQGNRLPEEVVFSGYHRHWASRLAVGAGPYRLLRHVPGERMVLIRNEGYHGEHPPIERIAYYRLNGRGQAFEWLVDGRLDIASFVSSEMADAYLWDAGEDSPFASGDLQYELADAFAYYYVGWNNDDPRFADARVRRAMTLAMNRQGIIEASRGLMLPQPGPYYWKHRANAPEIEALPFDPEEAARLLDEAGWTDSDGDGVRDRIVDGEKTDLRFTLLIYDKADFKVLCRRLQEDLERVGVVMELAPVSWPTMLRRMDERDYDAFTGGWGLSWFIDPYQIWHSSQADVPGGSNRVGFRNAEADAIIETLRTTFDADERVELLRRLHRIIDAEQPYTFLWAPRRVVAWNRRLKNVTIQKIRPQLWSMPWYFEE